MYENESTFVLDFYTKDMRLYSIIIPVYNRPDELDDLLSSLCKQTYVHFEVIVVEDGSEIPAKEIVGRYQGRLDLYYYVISNSGPGMARNHGARQARGEYLLILDSDVVLPSTWLEHIHDSLNHYPVDAFGGPDKAHASFSPIQKAINYAMTSFLTTGGIRGGKKKLDKFYPRSFNMGIRRDVYERLGGFSGMRYGEDIDFSIRIMEAGYRTRLFPSAWVYHKRRTDLMQFFRQVRHSGEARIALNRKHPGSLKLVHCLPALFTFSVCLLVIGSFFCWLFLVPLIIYALLLFVDAMFRNKCDLRVGSLSVIASFTQLFGYGSDLAYVLEHRDKYIRHLQEYKRKVCLCIENGGKGIGFCNMNDTQIADFVRQVKDVIERYQLDGVNLWDEDGKYGKAEMPGMNTTSYPRLIKALREALPDKLLTLVDKGDATEYFYDVSRCGGIEVGGYIDYAWHGYFSSTEELQIINPNLDGSVQTYSKYTRRSIAGLTETRYGCVNVPRYSSNDPNIRNRAADIICKWKSGGNKKSNILIYGDDLIGNEYGDRENAARIMLGDYSLLQFMDDGDGWDFSRDELIWGDVVYSGVSLDPGVEHAAGNTYRKDW